MYFKSFLLLSLVSAALCVYEDEKYYSTQPPPRILSHKQAQNHDGGFKFAFAADNGLAQTEVIAPDGSRNGGYTYIDPHGKTITVKYSAGKEGFRILQGEHIHKEVQQLHVPQQQPQYAHGPQSLGLHYSNSREAQDDGSYTAEKYEHPYETPETAARPEAPQPQYNYNYKPQVQQYKESPVFQEARLDYKPQYASQQQSLPQYVKQYAQPRLYEQTQSYQQPERQELSNSVEDEPKQRGYHHNPGKPFSFGPGYAFSFSN